MDSRSPNNALDCAVAGYTQRLAEIEARSAQTSICDIFEEIDKATTEVLRACASYEAKATPEEIEAACASFHEKTHPWFAQSECLMQTRIWPRGYQGDYDTLEGIYAGLPRSSTPLGIALDMYLLSREMANAARGRRVELCRILRSELQSRPAGSRILSIACGSCRDLFDIACDIRRMRPQIVCVDRDRDALEYARRLLLTGGIPTDLVSFVALNALRLVSLKEGQRRFGEQDIIYSVGFLDYLEDDRVSRLLETWYSLLRPGGALIVAMKDVTRFEPYTYRWLIKWTLFKGRTHEQMTSMFDAAGIPPEARETARDPSGIVVLWRVGRR